MTIFKIKHQTSMSSCVSKSYEKGVKFWLLFSSYIHQDRYWRQGTSQTLILSDQQEDFSFNQLLNDNDKLTMTMLYDYD